MGTYVGYIRVSKVGKRNDQPERFHSPDEQRAAIERKATELGVNVTILKPDLNKKGHHERETLMKAVEGVERGRYDGIIVPYLSRLSRRVRDTLEMWDRVKETTGRVIVVEGDLDSSKETPELRLQLTILAALAEHEHLKATERFAGQREAAHNARIWASPNVPAGWVKNPDTRQLEHQGKGQKSAAAVRQAFRDIGARRPVADVARSLGVSPAGLKYMIRNRLYLGELREKGMEPIPNAYPPIVTEDEWLEANKALGTAPRQPRGETAAYLLTGLVRCAECGYAMSPSTTQTGYPYYHCRHCSNSISGGKLEPFVESVARAEWQRMEARVEEDGGALDELRAEVRQAKGELAAYLEGVSASLVGADAFGEGARQRQEAVEAAEEALAAALAAAPSASVGEILEVYDTLPTKTKTRALAGLVEGVVVRSGNGDRNVPVSDRVRVIAYGAGVAVDGRRLGWRNGPSAGIAPIPFADLDDEIVLRV
jgi:DNA invertase Pin-like site-specific DNA recombinase